MVRTLLSNKAINVAPGQLYPIGTKKTRLKVPPMSFDIFQQYPTLRASYHFQYFPDDLKT